MMKVEKKLTILFTPLNSLGHVNGSLGLAQELQSRGHRVVWGIEHTFKEVLTSFGFEVEVHGPDVQDEDFWPIFLAQTGKYIGAHPLVISEKFILEGFRKMFSDDKEREHQYRHIIEKVKPDVIIIDRYVCSPILITSDIPWVLMSSAAPAMIFNDKRIAPACSGLPNDGDREEWQRFIDGWNKLFDDLQQEINDFCETRGGPKLTDKRLHPLSPYLNIYMWPKDLDHQVIQPLPDWIRVENFVRVTNETFEIPAQLSQRPGKLIYFSLGSIGCGFSELTKRLTQILAKSKHKFIVSKGPMFASNELPENMWGQTFLPQTAILPLVDLVITHGGNNTITESFHAGKPVLVMPLFGDQYDNAQRVVEQGFGLRLNPCHCSEDELLNAVDRLLNDKDLTQRMTAIGERIRKTNDKKIIADRIERIV